MKLMVIMLDTYRSRIAATYEGINIPPKKRLVQIELTPEQINLLSPRKVGRDAGIDTYEEISDVWLEF